MTSSNYQKRAGWRILLVSVIWNLMGVSVSPWMLPPARANHVYDSCRRLIQSEPKEQSAGSDTQSGNRLGVAARSRVSVHLRSGEQPAHPATAIVRSIYLFQDQKNFVEFGWKWVRDAYFAQPDRGGTTDPKPTVFIAVMNQSQLTVYEGSEGTHGNPNNPGWGTLDNFSNHHFRIKRIFDPDRTLPWYRFEVDGSFAGSLPHQSMGSAPPLAGVEAFSFCDSMGALFWELQKCVGTESSCTWQDWNGVRKRTDIDRPHPDQGRLDSSKWWKFQWGPDLNQFRMRHCGDVAYCEHDTDGVNRVLVADPCQDEPCDTPTPSPSPSPAPTAPPPPISWSDWERHSGGLAAGSGLDATSWQPGNLRVVSRSPANNVWIKSWDCCGAWSAWTSVSSPSGGITSNPAITSTAPNILHVFAKGTDNAIWTRKWNGANWGAWTSLGGGFTSGPDAVSHNGWVAVFARGMDDAIWMKSGSPDGTWTDWESLGGTLTSDPSVVRSSCCQTHVFARGTDGLLKQKWHDSSTNTWTAWVTPRGANLVIDTSPDASSYGNYRLDIFAAAGDSNGLYQLTGQGRRWYGWTSLGGGVTGDPGSVSWGSNRIDVFIRGTDNVMYHRWCEPCGSQ